MGLTVQGSWNAVDFNPQRTAGHFVDWSGLLDAPAGKHGFIRVVNGELQFEDDAPAKFWGTNFVAGDCFPDKTTADSVALRLSRIGVNLVRFHLMCD